MRSTPTWRDPRRPSFNAADIVKQFHERLVEPKHFWDKYGYALDGSFGPATR